MLDYSLKLNDLYNDKIEFNVNANGDFVVYPEAGNSVELKPAQAQELLNYIIEYLEAVNNGEL